MKKSLVSKTMTKIFQLHILHPVGRFTGNNFLFKDDLSFYYRTELHLFFSGLRIKLLFMNIYSYVEEKPIIFVPTIKYVCFSHFR